MNNYIFNLYIYLYISILNYLFHFGTFSPPYFTYLSYPTPVFMPVTGMTVHSLLVSLRNYLTLSFDNQWRTYTEPVS